MVLLLSSDSLDCTKSSIQSRGHTGIQAVLTDKVSTLYNLKLYCSQQLDDCGRTSFSLWEFAGLQYDGVPHSFQVANTSVVLPISQGRSLHPFSAPSGHIKSFCVY